MLTGRPLPTSKHRAMAVRSRARSLRHLSRAFPAFAAVALRLRGERPSAGDAAEERRAETAPTWLWKSKLQQKDKRNAAGRSQKGKLIGMHGPRHQKYQY